MREALRRLRNAWRHVRAGKQRRQSRLALARQLEGLPTSTFATIVAMPQCAHLAALSVPRLRGHYPVVCILNGLSRDEAGTLIERNAGVHFVHTPTLLPHHDVIDELIGAAQGPFWLVDHDCLVLSPPALRRAEAEAEAADAVGGVFFAERNQANGFLKPHTFLMLVNPAVCRSYFSRYGITSSPLRWEELPDAVRTVAEKRGFSRSVLPETYKDYFDTLAVLAVVAEDEGRGFRAAAAYSAEFAPHPEAIHFGHTSRPEFRPEWSYGAIGAYFWRLALTEMQSDRLTAQYLAARPDLADLAAMRRRMLEAGIDPTLLDYIDAVCARPAQLASHPH